MINGLISIYPEKANDLANKVVENIDKFDATKLQTVLEYSSYRNRGRILNALRDLIVSRKIAVEDFAIQDFKDIPSAPQFNLVRLYNEYSIPWYRPAIKEVAVASPLSQTEAHAILFNDIIKSEFQSALQQPEVQKILNTMHAQEKVEAQAGNVTFVHGCAWGWDLKQDLFTKLMEITHNKKFENFRFLRFKDHYDVTNADEKMHQALKDNQPEQFRPDVLFMNHALFGNSSNKGSCTFDYWYENHDQSVNNNRNIIDLEELFTKANMQDSFDKYKKDIKKLEQLHKKAENKGIILLISANQEIAQQSIYPAYWGAHKAHIATKDGKKLNTIQDIINTLKQNPTSLQNADQMEYGLLCSNKYVLNPDKAGKDIKIIPFSLAHGTPEYQEYCKKRDQLMANIARDIEEKNNPGLAQERENRLFNILAASA